jgi:signal transduction histidine kinase
MAPRARSRRFSLATRIYAAGVVLVAVCALVGWGIVHVLWTQAAPPHEFGRFTRFVAQTIAHDPDPQAAVERAERMLDADVALFDRDGTPVATTGPMPSTPMLGLSCGQMHERDHGGYDVGGGNGRTIVVLFRRRPHSRLPFAGGILGALLVIGLGAWLAGRWLTRPLARLGATARAIASGDLGSRTGIQSGDEIGDAAAAFDRMAERVEHLLRSQRELLASVSHELRTPLARIRVALDLASEAADGGSVQTELAGLELDIGELELLVSDLLASAQLDTNDKAELPLRREPCTLVDIVERARQRFLERHPRKVVALTIDEKREAELDPRLLRRALENVLENAHKYSDPDSAIRIDVRLEGTRAVVEITDDGIGIAEEDLAHVFTPFFRADRSEVRASSGLGLGLALARRIVDAHGGTIALESVLGQGTTVRISV